MTTLPKLSFCGVQCQKTVLSRDGSSQVKFNPLSPNYVSCGRSQFKFNQPPLTCERVKHYPITGSSQSRFPVLAAIGNSVNDCQLYSPVGPPSPIQVRIKTENAPAVFRLRRYFRKDPFTNVAFSGKLPLVKPLTVRHPPPKRVPIDVDIPWDLALDLVNTVRGSVSGAGAVSDTVVNELAKQAIRGNSANNCQLYSSVGPPSPIQVPMKTEEQLILCVIVAGTYHLVTGVIEVIKFIIDHLTYARQIAGKTLEKKIPLDREGESVSCSDSFFVCGLSQSEQKRHEIGGYEYSEISGCGG